jgi:hypothetical protein
MRADETTHEQFSFRGERSFWSWLFATFVSAVAVINFIQHVFGVQLMPFYAHGLYFYREVVHSAVGWLYAPFVFFVEWVASLFHFSLRISIPGWWKDLATLSTISVAALIRSILHGASLPITHRLIIILCVAFYGVTGIGFLVLFFIVCCSSSAQWAWIHRLIFILFVIFLTPAYPITLKRKLNYFSHTTQEDIDRRNRYMISLLAIAAATIIFFVTNAYSIF